MQALSPGILSGLRVIDCGTYIAAPAAATILSDFGADTEQAERNGCGRIERPRIAELHRHHGNQRCFAEPAIGLERLHHQWPGAKTEPRRDERPTGDLRPSGIERVAVFQRPDDQSRLNHQSRHDHQPGSIIDQ